MMCERTDDVECRQAVDRALQNRPALKAEAERVDVARGSTTRHGNTPTRIYLLQNENLRPGQTYSRDVDTLAYITQRLDLARAAGRAHCRRDRGIARADANYALARLDTIRRVSLAYWAARGAQDTRDLLIANADTFQRVVDYHNAQLSVGVIAEQDVLRIRLEGERLQIGAEARGARRARADEFS